MNTKRTLKRRLKALGLSGAMLAGALCLPGAAPQGGDLLANAAGDAASGFDANFAKLLQYSIYFYDANMCGTDVSENNQLNWRGDCHTYDAQVPMDTEHTNLSSAFLTANKDYLDPDGDGFIDVSGGFHDAGDHVKFGMPENYSAATVGWGYYEFRDAYAATGQDAHVETILRYFNDYLMRCTFLDDSGDVVAFCYQVGDGDIDHAYWQAPEIDTMDRPAFFLTGDKPQTDYVASAAASLAINYLNFKDTDEAYAAKSLKYANALYDFARDHEKELSDNGDGPKQYYSSSKWQDDYCWASAWMYKITGDHAYLEEIYPYYDYYAAPCYVYCWNDMWGGVQCVLGEIVSEMYPNFIDEYKEAAGKSPYEEMDCWASVKEALDTYMSGGIGEISPQGYFWLNTWGSARYNTAAQLIAMVYDKYTNNNQPSKYSDWAKGQMEYLMGNNDITYQERIDANAEAENNGNPAPYSADELHGPRCFIVGFNDVAAAYPHHRASSGLSKCEDTKPQKHVLVGALVGGPDNKDLHNDVTKDWIYNEVTIDYNAAFVGASAGLYHFYGTDAMQPDPDIDLGTSEEEGGGQDYWVEAYAVDDKQTSGAGVTKLAMLVCTDSNKPRTDISVRYYFSVKELSNPSNVSLVKGDELYDQTSVETEFDGVLSGPYQYDASFDPDIYYIEVKWDGYNIANANKKYQLAVGFYYGDTWDPTNDWSYQGITKCKDTYQDGSEARTDYICVYSGDTLVGGIEPNGNKPVVTTAATTEGSGTTTTTTTTTTDTTVLGDVDGNGKVEVNDLVRLARYVAQDQELTPALTAQQVTNADVNCDGTVDASDLTMIARALARLISLEDFGK